MEQHALHQDQFDRHSSRRAMPNRLILVRHGESEQNVINRLAKKGELKDYPLVLVRFQIGNLDSQSRSPTPRYLNKIFGRVTT